jgi:cytochrome c-type biogenesis protein
LAGIFSFLSPCVLPLIPGYLSIISGLSVEQLGEGRQANLARVFFASVLFSLGLCLVFIPMGIAFGAVGKWLAPHMQLLNIVLGAVVIVFGLFVMNVVKIPLLYHDRRIRLNRAFTGIWAAPFLGMAFGAGWSPCLGPWISGLGIAATKLPPLSAGLLFAIYGLALGACFVATGLLFAWAIKALSFFQRHYRAVEFASGSLLMLMGILMVTGQWAHATALLMKLVETW